VLGAWLAREGAHVDEARREHETGAVDDRGSLRSRGRGAPRDIRDGAVAHEHAAAPAAAGGGVDEVGVGEEERGHSILEEAA
jgi:hypothetical protein